MSAIQTPSAEAKQARAWRVLHALYAKRAPSTVLRRAERIYHRAACAAFVEAS